METKINWWKVSASILLAGVVLALFVCTVIFAYWIIPFALIFWPYWWAVILVICGILAPIAALGFWIALLRELILWTIY